MPQANAIVPDAEETISRLDLPVVLLQRKRLTMLTTLVFTSLAAGVSWLWPVKYTATITILPPQQHSSALVSQSGSMAALAGGSLGLPPPNDMYVAMLRSRTVEDAIVQKFGLMHLYHVKFALDARNILEKNTVISGSGRDGLIHVSVTDRDPHRAAELANGYIDQFRGLSEHLAITEAAQRRLFFQQQLEEAKNQLANAEDALKNTEQLTGVISNDGQLRALLELATTLRARVAAREVAIQGMQTYANGRNAQVIEAEKELEMMRAQLAQLGGSSSQSGDLIIPKGKIPQAGLEYMRKMRDVKYYETIVEILAKQFEVAKLDEAQEGSLIQVVDAAVPPDRRSSPEPTLIVVAATLAGFLMGIFVALVGARLEKMKTDPEVAGKLRALKSLISLSGFTPRKDEAVSRSTEARNDGRADETARRRKV